MVLHRASGPRPCLTFPVGFARFRSRFVYSLDGVRGKGPSKQSLLLESGRSVSHEPTRLPEMASARQIEDEIEDKQRLPQVNID